jgi:hypothetical protein
LTLILQNGNTHFISGSISDCIPIPNNLTLPSQFDYATPVPSIEASLQVPPTVSLQVSYLVPLPDPLQATPTVPFEATRLQFVNFQHLVWMDMEDGGPRAEESM